MQGAVLRQACCSPRGHMRCVEQTRHLGAARLAGIVPQRGEGVSEPPDIPLSLNLRDREARRWFVADSD